MLNQLYRRTRRFLSPIHPNRLRAKARGQLQHGRDYLRDRWRTLYLRRLLVLVRWTVGALRDLAGRRFERRMTVAVDISALWEPLTGIGWYLYRLLEHLADRDDLCLRLYGPNLINSPDLPPPVIALPEGPAIEIVTYTLPESGDLPVAYSPLVLWLRERQDRLIAADGNRLLFAPNYLLPQSFARCRGRLILTVHDLSFERVPWTMKEETRQHLATNLRRNAAQAVRLITDSETVRGELIESGIVESQRVDAVPLGPGPTAKTEAGDLPEQAPDRYALHVGTIEPRKNLPILFDAWRMLKQRRKDLPTLVLCGRFGWKSETLAREVERGQNEGWLLHFGYLADAQVAALYQHAHMVVLPSIYEGFGLPAVEAMCFGAPLICSDIPVLREVAADGARFADPQSPEAWCEAISELLEDPTALSELSRRGQQRGAAFCWSKTAEETARIWRQALDERRR